MQAYNFYKQAEDSEPGFWTKNTLQLAKCCTQLEQGKKQERREWLQLTLERTAVGSDTDDRAVREEAQRMLIPSDEICIHGPACAFFSKWGTCDHHHSNAVEQTGVNFDVASVKGGSGGGD